MAKIKSFNFLLALLLNSAVSPATANEINVKDSNGQAKTENSGSYSALGIRTGSFMLFPTIESANDWNNNIYSRQTDTRSDFIFHIKPALNIKSNWSRHALNLSTGADVMFYKDYTKEDKQNYFAAIDGKLDVFKNGFATAKIYYQHQAEDRGSPNQIASLSAAPLENETFGATVGYEHKINRLRAKVSHDINQINFKNGGDAFNNPVLNNQRTRTVNTSEVLLGYELFSGYETYIRGSYNFIDYKNHFVSQGNLDRSSQGYNIGMGIKFDLSHTMVGDAHLGYMSQSYQDSRLKPITGMSGGLNLTWLPTRLTTVNMGVNRSIQETTQIGLTGFFSTAFTASVDHELMRNIFLNAHAGYTNNDYHGTNTVNRQEDLYSAGFKIKYLLNRYLYLQTGYDYKNRTVNINGSDYDINNVYLTIGAQL